MRTLAAALAAGLLFALAASASSAPVTDTEPTLVARAILPADAYQPGPPSGAFITPNNGVTPPFPGQPIPGFSAVLDAGRGEFWGMPDNGYGAKGNSGDFLLRLYRIRPDFKTARGGSGRVAVLGFVQLRDPERKVPFRLYRSDRLLTGADFDLESVRRTKDGGFWFGEEFGPFLLHTDQNGVVLGAPVPLPGVQSPQNPFLPSPDTWTLPASRGFEGMALSVDGTKLYPVAEGALRNDPDRARRLVYEFDLRGGAYTGRTWSYRVDSDFPNAVIGDFTALDEHRFVLIERDDDQGAEARQKKIYLVDLRRTDRGGYLEKRLVLDLLRIRDPDGISLPARPGEFGVGDPFGFPLQSVESLETLGGGRLLIANDNNYPGSDGRWIARDRPDDTELIIVQAPALHDRDDVDRGEGAERGRGGFEQQLTLAVIGDTPYGDPQKAAFPSLVAAVNSDPKVDLVLHLGDIKTGTSVCTDSYFAEIRALFDSFADPLVYTPGDNEWTDCHRARAGGYNPLERLAQVRAVFYPRPGLTLGRNAQWLLTQAEDDGFEQFVENHLWLQAGVAFATLHVVGSNNGRAPWFGDRSSGPETAGERAQRVAEVEARIAAALDWLDETFELAAERRARGVVLAMQADMWDAAPADGFNAIVQRIADLAAEFGKPVLLFEGDSHRFTVDKPLASGSPLHGVRTAAPNVTRIVVEGETVGEWLRLTVDPRSPHIFSWQRITR